MKLLGTKPLLGLLFSASVLLAQQTPVEVAARFVPPNSSLQEFEVYSPSTGQPIQRQPAVVKAHVVSSQSNDIVFAYKSVTIDSEPGALFVAVLHETPSGYVKISEESYYARRLWVQDFRTVGLKVFKPSMQGPDVIAIITEVGASAGGDLQVLRWDPSRGLITCLSSPAPPAYNFRFSETSRGSEISLSFEKYPGQVGVRPPVTYRWDGKLFVH